MPSENPHPSSTGPYDLAVVGAGVIGLATALEESLRGRRVAVIDAGAFGLGASWAAAGILNTRAGLLGNSPFREFHLRSVGAYPEWIARVESASGRTVPYSRAGDYQIFPLDDPASRLALHEREDQLFREKAHAFTVRDAWPDFLAPHAAPGPVRVFHYPGEAYIQNRVLLESLTEALRRGGAGLFPGARVEKIGRENGVNVLEAVAEGRGVRILADQVLIAAGTGCNEILGLLGLSLPLSPVKGQLAMLPRFYSQDTMVHGVEKFYLIPRGDRLIAGATTERGVDDTEFNALGDAYLTAQLRRFFPRVKPDWVETWSGLRPRCADRLPVMGWVDEAAGIAISTGHYKSGISLAPLSARCLSALLHGEKPPASLAPFDPWRAGALQSAAA
jgi:glycine oxidase